MRRALIIFAKNPELGKVKTRLAQDLGQSEALEWYIKLMKRTEAAVQGLCAEKTVFWSNAAPMHPPAFGREEFEFAVQQGDGLGERMKNAFNSFNRKGYNSFIIIGTDCWDLKPGIIENAYQELKNNDVVIGPAKDGGYYLLGTNDFHPELFENVEWSTDVVLEQTVKKCEKLSLSVKLLQKLSDVDNIYDLPME
ncbi:TIGR04282 family arsenosugar biosynthesis glycosyltransferase [Luteibaculum oceani]|uniref:Glycosyltransferase n=1 Tax=Luteibaculum oceani TaxID=1294296 RepID=A0A5C6UWN1_9FLAO|nr:TIGR04282 family arsenosugar biosynthesis glycosyltransferase [Luteibaculum oceani]TXC76990.1 glycosyltransferase [Luteibaculum oceani]